ncbi:TPA: hypothetical protein DIC40_02915 [Patescibacteria group bacterium]|nr:hypothetical protein [Candidatus Gracilibacteria bacterium]
MTTAFPVHKINISITNFTISPARYTIPNFFRSRQKSSQIVNGLGIIAFVDRFRIFRIIKT